MTFAKLINILNLLDHDKDIMVVRKSVNVFERIQNHFNTVKKE